MDKISDDELTHISNHMVEPITLAVGEIVPDVPIKYARVSVGKLAKECIDSRKRIKEYEELLLQAQSIMTMYHRSNTDYQLWHDLVRIWIQDYTALQSVTNDTKVTDSQSIGGE